MAEQLKERILSSGIIAICRKIYQDDLRRLTEALAEGGIRQLEVTFDQSDAGGVQRTAEAICDLCGRFPEMDFGAGTVLTVEQAEAARAAGGTFIISPSTDLTVIRRTKELGMVSIPGAMTPSEIAAAHYAGADIVKLFPAGALGERYIREIRGPLGHIQLLATGGVTLENFGTMLRAGCCGAGLGGALCDKALLQAKDWSGLTERARRFAAIVQEARS